MDALVVLALVVAVVFCTLPGILAWRYYSSGEKRTAEKRHVIHQTQPAKA